jgi:hypothetical protein
MTDDSSYDSEATFEDEDNSNDEVRYESDKDNDKGNERREDLREDLRDDPLENGLDDNIDEGTEVREVKCKAKIEDILRNDIPKEMTSILEREEVIPEDRELFSENEFEAQVRHRTHHKKPKPSEVLTPEEFAIRAELLMMIRRYIEEYPEELRDFDYLKIRDVVDIEVLERIFESMDRILSAYSSESTFKELYFMGTEYMETWGLKHGWKVKDYALKIRRGKNKDGSQTENRRVLNRCAIRYSSVFRSNALVQLGISTLQSFTHYHGLQKAMAQMKRNDKPISQGQYDAFHDL